MCWVALVKVHLQTAGKAAQWNAVRTLIAASHIHYYVLNGSKGGMGISEDEWAVVIGRQLLTPDERERVNQYKGMKPLLKPFTQAAALAAVERQHMGHRSVNHKPINPEQGHTRRE